MIAECGMRIAEYISRRVRTAAFGNRQIRNPKSEIENSQSGFTLLEILIVLVLVTLMLGLSAIIFGGTLSSGRLDAAARDVSSTIRYAKSLAQINGKRQIVSIDLDSRQYGIEGGSTKSLPKDVQVMIKDQFAGEIRSGGYRIAFQPYAGVEGGTIVLWNAKKSISVQLDPVVGTVIIK